jgi:electron transfer flavoprotein beta subunit
MGPGRAAEVVREGMYRGADGGYLLTDRAFAGSDTLATSYAISCAIKKIGCDIVIAGRQAIDGDTAQVGPQVAEKLGLPQVTYAEDVQKIEKNFVIIKRRLERGVELVSTPIPCVITVNATAPESRVRNAKALMKFKHAKTITELQGADEDYIKMHDDRPYLRIEELSVADVEADTKWLGLSGSPTKVKTIQNVVFAAKEAKRLTSDKEEINALMNELLANHTLGN